jgi:hypothetical protein
VVHNESFNVGNTNENYRVREVAEMVREVVPGSRVTYAPDGGPDARCYRVDCSKIERLLPDFRTTWTVREGIEELYDAFVRHRLSLGDLEGARYIRISRIRERIAEGSLDGSLRLAPTAAASI